MAATVSALNIAALSDYAGLFFLVLIGFLGWL
jgi:hypothetical protein